MEDLKSIYKSLTSTKNLDGITTNKALENISILIDISLHLKQMEGLTKSLALLEELQERNLTIEEISIYHYFSANSWHNIRVLSKENIENPWYWEQKEMENEIIHLRKASYGKGFSKLPNTRKCQILTNLGNLMSHIGRFVEAIEYWQKALVIMPSFGMARGNIGYGLVNYAYTLYDQGHASILLNIAYNDMNTALSSKLEKGARKGFKKQIKWIESILSDTFLKKELNMQDYSLGKSTEETMYRQWCLDNCLFLNPLNDIGPHPIAATDPLTSPSVVVNIGEGPYYPGFFNQMKQEFVSARYLYYTGIKKETTSFSDRDVLLFNTLDYPIYSLSIEKVKASFRIFYSLFDKIAYFLNHYLDFNINKQQVNFRTFWYISQNRTKGLLDYFKTCENWPLRGLFWLSKDLYEKRTGFKEAIEPEAKSLYEIRNHLEHKYLKVHDDLWTKPESYKDILSGLTDTLAYSLYRKEFELKTMKLMKMVRASLIYLSLAVHSEECHRAKCRKPDSITPSMPMDVWEDDWKT